MFGGVAMKTPRLCLFFPWGQGFGGLDIHGCAWIKRALHLNWERLETPHEQTERLKPGHKKRSKP